MYVLIGNVEFEWTNRSDIAFVDLKTLVSIAPVLQGKNWNLPFHISIDAFDTTIGVVLGHEEDKNPYAIYYIGKNLTSADLNYTTMEKEFLDVVYYINIYRKYVEGYLVSLYTDHYGIRYLVNKHVTNGQIT